MAFHIEQTLRMVNILGILLITSCIDMRETVHEGSDAEKNLAAIRELLRPPGGRESIQLHRSGGDTLADMHEGLQSLNEMASPSDAGTTHSNYIPLSSQFMAMSKGGVHSGHLPVYIPWRPSAPNAANIAEPFRPVPPYFTIMPPISGFPGPARCSPDFSGGQRCH
jgi:hypothetical protein